MRLDDQLGVRSLLYPALHTEGVGVNCSGSPCMIAVTVVHSDSDDCGMEVDYQVVKPNQTEPFAMASSGTLHL